MNRILVTGSRDWRDPRTVREALSRAFLARPDKDAGVVVVHGGARGADAMAGRWVRDFSCVGNPVEEERHPADWSRHGRAAGAIRNGEMVALGAYICLAFIRNNSRGATHCATWAERAGIPVLTFRDDEEAVPSNEH